MSEPPRLVPVALALAALVAFAANSVLCRLALGGGSAIDPFSFTVVRIGSGAFTLAALVLLRPARGAKGGAGDGEPPRAASLRAGSLRAAAWLLLYAVPFSFAYVDLDTGTGALLLFAAVQLTMIAAGLRAGERPGRLEWIGFAMAFGGLVYLVSPGLSAPSPLGAALMVAAGVGWGLYSLAGKGSTDPTATTAGNFVRAAIVLLPFAGAAQALSLATLDPRGALIAVASGAVASGLGYAVWYAALRTLAATRAAFIQLAVPVIAAAGGILFLGETLTLRLAIAGAVVLGGVGLSIAPKAKRAKPAAR